MALDGELNQLDASTRRFIRNSPKLVDAIYHHDPHWAMARMNLREDFPGGSRIGEDFVYRPQIGGSYLPGADFNLEQRQVEQQAQFELKYYYANITLTGEDVHVLNKGPMASYRLVDSRVSNAYETLGQFVPISMYLNGINANYTALPNGLSEALNDNSTDSWDDNLYSTYGGLDRTGTQGGNRLVSAPTNINNREIEYKDLTETYEDACFGSADYEPNIGVTTPTGFNYIEEKFQTQQRFTPNRDNQIGGVAFPGLNFKNAVLMKSRLCPGTYISTSGNDANDVAVEYLKQSSGNAITAYPTLKVANSETLWWLNARKPWYNWYLSNSPKYQFGFTGWKPGQGNTKIAAQVLLACAFTWFPRYHKQVYGFTA